MSVLGLTTTFFLELEDENLEKTPGKQPNIGDFTLLLLTPLE